MRKKSDDKIKVKMLKQRSAIRSPRWSSCGCPRILLAAALLLGFDPHRGEIFILFAKKAKKWSINCWERLAAWVRYNSMRVDKEGKKMLDYPRDKTDKNEGVIIP